jgi:hypothetical protein
MVIVVEEILLVMNQKFHYMSGGRCINQKFFVRIQNNIHIVLTKHQQLERYKISIKKLFLIHYNAFFTENKSRHAFTLLKLSIIESVLND